LDAGEVVEGEAMTEAEWLACADPTPMLDFMEKRLRERKLRLFAVACCRNLWDQTSSEGQRAVEVAERFADAAANERALARAGTAAGLLVSGVMMAGHQWAAFACHPRALYAAHSAAYAARQAFSAGFFFPETERAVQAQFLHDIVGNPFHSE